jgi:SAM-dependent methyltransferase
MTTDGVRTERESPADWRTQYLARYYSTGRGASDHWPSFVRTHTPAGGRVLEIGGGPVDWTTGMLRESAREIIGVDIDPLVRTNRLLDQAIVYDGARFPLPDGRFDLAISRWVNEHLPDPALHFSEVQRILAPGGLYVFRTVNVYHYKTVGAWLTPHWLQVPVVRWLCHMSKKEHDPYPTYYRANTRRRITTLCQEAGLTPVLFEMSEGYPTYGMASKALFRLFMGYERLVNSSGRFAGFRHTIDAVARKPI